MADATLGPFLKDAELVRTLAWTGQDDAPIGVVLDYRFTPPVDLPMEHGQIYGSGGEGDPGKYDKNGFPLKRDVPADASYPDTERAEVYVDVAGGSVYAANQTSEDYPC